MLLAIWLGGIALAGAADDNGCRQRYRQQSVISDFTLGREWTVYARCAHPESPRVAIMIEPATGAPAQGAEEAALGSAPAAPLVRMGNPVRLWLSSPVARIALSGIALENGAAGATIRVRVMPGGKVLNGTVRAPDSVELVAAGFDRAGQ
jgi:hypothetical protein